MDGAKSVPLLKIPSVEVFHRYFGRWLLVDVYLFWQFGFGLWRWIFLDFDDLVLVLVEVLDEFAG